MNNEFDPYAELMELIKFAKSADNHINLLVKNQSQLIIAINELSAKVEKIEEKIYETSRPKR